MRAYEVTSCMNDFAVNIFRRLKDNAEKNANIFFGPASIYSALAMLYAGSRGTTAEELKTLLCLPKDSVNFHETFAKMWNDILTSNNIPNGCTLDVANRVWIKRNQHIEEAYLIELKRNYQADAANVDFFGDVEGSREEINKWIAENTNDKIINMIKPGTLSNNTNFMLTSAMYFYGEWKSEFEERNTRPMPFYAPDGTMEVDMMYQKSSYGYHENKYYDCKVCLQSYRKSKLKMVVVLPNTNDGISKLEEMLLKDKFKGEYMWDWSDIGRRDVHLYLPKFRISVQTDLVDHLRDLGVDQLFTNADLGGITKTKDLCVNGVSHAAYIDVNERGTEVAVCTTSGIMKAGISRHLEVKADHPFLFMIVDKDTEAILFWGKVCKPVY